MLIVEHPFPEKRLSAVFSGENLFMMPLDSRGDWYRYHHLFQDLLVRQHERERSPQEIRQVPQLR